MNALLILDHSLFSIVQSLPHTDLLVWIALWVSGIGLGGFIWLLISIWLFYREERRDHMFFLPVVVASFLSLVITEFVLKQVFARNRPPGAHMSDYSFPSGHATFAWALAVVLAAKEPRARWIFFTLAVVICFSRVYLGVHYPADIVAGSMVGLAIGLFSLWLERLVIQYRHVKTKRKRTSDAAR